MVLALPILGILGVQDIRTRHISNRILAALMVLSIIFGVCTLGIRVTAISIGIMSIISFALWWFGFIGGADVKLLAVIGGMVGLRSCLLILKYAIILQGIIGTFVIFYTLFCKGMSREEVKQLSAPFVPFLFAGALICYIFSA